MELPKALFVSHGSPMIVLEASSASDFLARLGRSMPKPKAALVVSAHWREPDFTVGSASQPDTIHDFFGFPPALYQMRYPAPGAPDLAARLAQQAGLASTPHRGLDHGVWTVAHLMWPDADVPVLPLSLSRQAGPREHYQLGQRLRPLLDDGVLLLASGAATHNLRAYVGQPRGALVQDWVSGFTDWLGQAIEAGQTEALLDYRRQAPYAIDNHPTDEHLMPLFVALGAGVGAGEVLHRSVEHGVIAMDSYGWAA